MAKDNTLMWVAIGVGAYLILSKSGSVFASPATPQPYPPTQAGGGTGGTLLASLFPSIFGPNGSYTVSQIPTATGGATDVTNINQVGAPPEPANATLTPVTCVSNGNVCDPNDCDYNEQVCQEMYGYTV